MRYALWPVRLILFALWYIKELLVSNGRVVADNVTPGQNSTPGIARYATRCRSDAEVTLLSSLITLTPGTLTMGTVTRAGKRWIYVHALYSESPDAVRAEIKKLEGRMLHAIRPGGLT